MDKDIMETDLEYISNRFLGFNLPDIDYNIIIKFFRYIYIKSQPLILRYILDTRYAENNNNLKEINKRKMTLLQKVLSILCLDKWFNINEIYNKLYKKYDFRGNNNGINVVLRKLTDKELICVMNDPTVQYVRFVYRLQKKNINKNITNIIKKKFNNKKIILKDKMTFKQKYFSIGNTINPLTAAEIRLKLNKNYNRNFGTVYVNKEMGILLAQGVVKLCNNYKGSGRKCRRYLLDSDISKLNEQKIINIKLNSNISKLNKQKINIKLNNDKEDTVISMSDKLIPLTMPIYLKTDEEKLRWTKEFK